MNRTIFKNKKLLKFPLIVIVVFILISSYFRNSLFMKTTYISDWDNKGYVCYYFDNGLYIYHRIKRVIKERRFEEGNIHKYYIAFPIKFKFVSAEKAHELKSYAFDELDVMNKELPIAWATDCTETTTFYQNFKTKTYDYGVYFYLETLINLYYK